MKRGRKCYDEKKENEESKNKANNKIKIIIKKIKEGKKLLKTNTEHFSYFSREENYLAATDDDREKRK